MTVCYDCECPDAGIGFSWCYVSGECVSEAVVGVGAGIVGE